MSKYYKAEDVIRKRAEDLADTSYWEWGNPKNVDDWIEVAEMEFKDLPTIEVMEYPQVEGITPTLVTIEPQTERPCDNCQEWDCYGCEYKQTENIKVTCDMVGSKNEIEYQLPKCEKCINYGVEFTEDDSIDTCLLDECHYEPKNEQSSMVGEWINKQEKYQMAECSNCKKVTMQEMWGDKLVYYDYCPNCGAKMKGADDE